MRLVHRSSLFYLGRARFHTNSRFKVEGKLGNR